MAIKCDFAGWATRNNLKCSDGRVIIKDAFSDQNGEEVPLVWNHQHSGPENILGHALLENRDEGVYAYCFFNNNKLSQSAKEAVKHGDIKSLSIYANQLVHKGPNVIHGAIREVSLVLAGANPGAFIDNIMMHGEECDDDGIIYTGCDLEFDDNTEKIKHSEEETKTPVEDQKEKNKEEKKDMEKEKSVNEIIDSMTEEQQDLMFNLVGLVALDSANAREDNEKEREMKHNVFEGEDENYTAKNVLTHSELNEALYDAKTNGRKLSETVLEHADGDVEAATVTYGIEHIDYLYPEAKNLTAQPTFIKRPTEWVADFMGSISKSPFSKIKSIHANITADEARAKGYIKGHRKEEEVFTLLKRKTEPTTIYKKQKLDRDDIIDITDFSVVNFVKQEMRVMLDEEIARAMLVGDGRSTASDDKIPETNIRPVWTDDDLYTIKVSINVTTGMTDDQIANAFIRAAIKARKDYRGSGSPRLYTTEDMLTDMLLLTDTTGRDLFESEAKLTTKLRVSKAVTVPIMENLKRTVNGKEHQLLGIIINPADYTSGADKGGSINMFEDFDIDYNQEKYLMETRCSGALRVPYSAIVIEAVRTPENNEQPQG